MNKIYIDEENSKIKIQGGVKNRELYEIYFYSGIVENNIKFTITSNNIK